MWERFLHSLILKKTEFDFSKINWLRGIIILHSNSVVALGKVPLCHNPIRPLLTFQDQISILIVGCMTTWLQGLHYLVSEQGFENKSYPFEISVFLLFVKFFQCLHQSSSSLCLRHTIKKITFFFIISKHISLIKVQKKTERKKTLFNACCNLEQKHNS
jgi:hypothetical protein